MTAEDRDLNNLARPGTSNPSEPYLDRGRKNGGPLRGPDDPSNREVYASFGAFGVARRLKHNKKIPTRVGKCDHERVHEDEDGKRCLYCAAWL
jgi:hypothetical protein